jgi:hypothetical protein
LEDGGSSHDLWKVRSTALEARKNNESNPLARASGERMILLYLDLIPVKLISKTPFRPPDYKRIKVYFFKIQ